jgi:hypothetical protein
VTRPAFRFAEATGVQPPATQEKGNNAVQPISIIPAANPQAHDRAAVVTADILQIIRRALFGWLYNEHADLAGMRAVIEARVHDEIEAALRPPPYPPDEP